MTSLSSINALLDEWKTAAFKLVSEFQDEEFSKAETDMANRILFLIDVVRNQREVIEKKDEALNLLLADNNPVLITSIQAGKTNAFEVLKRAREALALKAEELK